MSFSHKFPASSLREYDIRGIVGETLGEADAFAIGLSLIHISEPTRPY